MLFAEKKNNEIKRKNRIQQVREQSKHFASTIRRRVQAQQGRPPAPAPALASKAPSAPAPRQYFSQLPAVGINDLISPRQAKRIRDQEWKVNKEYQMNRIPSTDAGASKTNTRPTLVVNNSRRRRTQSTENKSKLSTESTNIDKFYSEKNMDAENECIVRNEDTITVLAEAPNLSPSPSFNASPSKPLISVDDLKHRTLDPTLYRVVPLETLRQMNNANDDLAKRDDDFPKRDDRTQTTLRKNLRVNFSTENDLERPCESAVFNNVSNYIKNRPFVDHNFQMDYDNASMNLNDDLDSIRHTLFQARQSSSVVPEVPKLPVHYPHINTFTPESNNDIDRVKYERPVTRPKKHLVSKTVNHPQKSVTYLTRKVCSCKPNKKSKTESKQTMLNKCRAPKSSNCLTSQFSANRDHSINSSYVKKLLKDGIDAYKSALDVSSNIDLQNNSVTKIITRDTSPKKLVNTGQNTSPKKIKHPTPVKKLEKSVQVNSSINKNNDNEKTEHFMNTKKSPQQKVNIVPEKESSESITSSSNGEKHNDVVSSSEKDHAKYSEKFDFNILFNHIEKQKEKILKEVQKIALPTQQVIKHKHSDSKNNYEGKIENMNSKKPISPNKKITALISKPETKNVVKNRPNSKVSNAISFEDLQIIIEVKKANKKVEKNVTNNKGEIIESVSQTDSSNEYSIRASKITSKKKIVMDNKENIQIDTSESTSYWSPPEKIHFYKHFEAPYLSSSEKVVSEDNVPVSLVPNVKNIDEKFNIDTNLKTYIEKLLDMPKKNIESLKVNTSEISTPGCSVIDVSSNKFNGNERRLNEKLFKLKEFIRNNYILLEELQSDNFMTSGSSKKCINSSDTSSSHTAMKNITWKRELSKNVTPQTSTSTSKDNIPHRRVKDKIRKKKIKSEKQEIRNSDNPSSHPLSSEDFSKSKNKEKIPSNLKSVHSAENPVNEPLEILEETFDKLSEQCVKKISDLNDQLDKVRKDKQLTISSGSNSSGENESFKNISKSEDHHDNAFTPILLDIPKPLSLDQKDDISARIGVIQKVSPKESKNDDFIPLFPPSGNNELQNKDFKSGFPHELSTIIEVDTPITLKNTLKDTSSAVDSVIESNKNMSESLVIPVIDKVEKENTTSVPDNWKEEVDISLKPFISFKDFVKTTDGSSQSTSILEESTSNDTLPDIIPEMLKRNLIDKPYFDTSENLTSLDALIKKDITSSNKKSKKLSPVKNPNKDIKDIDQSIIEFENVLKSIGMEWAVSTFRKTGEAMDLSSSSSSVIVELCDPKKHSKSDDPGTTFSNINLSNTSCGMSTLIDDWNISANLLKEYSLGNISKTSFDKYLEAFLKKLNEQEKLLEKGKSPEDFSVKDQKDLSDDINKKSPEKSQTEENINTLQGSKDKTQHQTSTPVKLAKSLSSTDSRLGGDYLFSMEDELSSVKNTSHTEKNSSSDDNKTLSVPNISLKFGKLFDSNNN